jgi:hypothetical protein
MNRVLGSVLAGCCSYYGIFLAIASPYQVETLSENTLWACPNCTLTDAESLGATKGAGTHIAYDLPGNHIYRLSCEPDGTTILCFGNALTSGFNYTNFQSYRGLWLTNGSSEHFAFERQVNILSVVPNNPNGGRPDDGYINAFDTVTNGASLNSVIDNVISQQQFDDSIIYPPLDNPPGSTFTNYSGSDEGTVCTFHDGSERTLHHDKTSKVWSAVSGTAKDADHNPLPETPPAGYQSYNFGNPVALYDSQNMYLLLAPAQLPPDGPGGNCESETFDGHSVHCIHPY